MVCRGVMLLQCSARRAQGSCRRYFSTSMKQWVGAIDQGTSSSRFIVFDDKGEVVASAQREFDTAAPHSGWAQQDPDEAIWRSVVDCIDDVSDQIDLTQLQCVGITNQRETTVIWDKHTGQPLHDALVWLDSRTAQVCEELAAANGGVDCWRDICGLPISTYFSLPKLLYLRENCEKVAAALDSDNAAFGTVESWLLHRLTKGEVHATDVTNASRTMLLDLNTMSWNESLLEKVGLPKSMLPRLVSNAEVVGRVVAEDSSRGLKALAGVPISGLIGDQQAALVGQGCLSQGECKNTYGTGCFLLLNTGTKKVESTHGLLSTVGFQLGRNEKPHFALEGSVAVAGAGVKFLRDNLGIISKASEVGELGSQVASSGGVVFVPALSGLLCPHWRSDARGTILGLSFSTDRRHICRAVVEAAAFQTTEVLEAMQKDAGIEIHELRVDGGMSNADLLCQEQATLAQCKVTRPHSPEATALGAAICAAIGSGRPLANLHHARENASNFLPSDESADKTHRRKQAWSEAVRRSFDWARFCEEDTE
ncbi:MAG: hypothetical protein MHM6MM_006374 [Cercozoa sp. M6MM]